MVRLNLFRFRQAERTHEGAPARRLTPEQALKRTLMNCLLWEGSFYEDGVEIAERMKALVPLVPAETVAAMVIEAREVAGLRHAPLLIIREMARHESHKGKVADLLARVIRRADELAEFLAIYWAGQDGLKKESLSAQVKKGLARAFTKFDAYGLAKYDRDGVVRLRDVLFLVHAKPKDADQAATWNALIDRTLPPPDTWEVALSAGADKNATFERLIAERKLGALALIRNLRNMSEAGVDADLVKQALAEMKVDRVFPYRFITAARHAPAYEAELEAAMFRSLAAKPRLKGRTRLLLDVSGSMNQAMSGRSEATRLDAACGLAVMARELCETVEIFTFSDQVMQVANRRGMALRDAILASQPHGGTYLGKALETVDRAGAHRLIVFTDEQSHDRVPDPKGRGYMVNVAAYKNGVGYGPWVHIDGFSEAVLDWIRQSEE